MKRAYGGYHWGVGEDVVGVDRWTGGVGGRFECDEGRW